MLLRILFLVFTAIAVIPSGHSIAKQKSSKVTKNKKKVSESKKIDVDETATTDDPNKNLLQPYGLVVNADQALIFDYQSKQVLLEKNAAQILEPASLTKIMSAYMVMHNLKQGRIKETDLVTVSKNAYDQEGSRMFLNIGQQVSVIELLKGILVVSGNDASVAMAEFLSGTEQNFAESMTRTAQEMGCKNTCFKNASGIPVKGHFSTAQDLIIMGIRFFEDFPEYYYLNKQVEYTFNNIKQQNRNLLLNKNIGCDGIKTGYAESPGYGVVSSAIQKNRRLFIVCTGLRSKKQRAEENLKLMQWAFQTFANYTVTPNGQEIVQIPVKYGDKDYIGLEAKNHCVTINRSRINLVKVNIKYPSYVGSPIKKGDYIGEITIKHPDLTTPATVKLIAREDVGEASFLKRIGQSLSYLFTTPKPVEIKKIK